MILPKGLTLLLFSMIAPFGNTMALGNIGLNALQPIPPSSPHIQPDKNMFSGYRTTFLWSAALIDPQNATNAPVRMDEFYTDVSAQAQREIASYSSQNPGQQFPGIWEFWQDNRM